MKSKRNVIILIITIVSVVLVATLIHEHYQKQIFRDGDIISLSDCFEFYDWEEAVIINTPNNFNPDLLYELGLRDGQRVESLGDVEKLAVVIFYRNKEVCNTISYNYSNGRYPVFCASIPTTTLPTDIINVSKKDDAFLAIKDYSAVYAVKLLDN